MTEEQKEKLAQETFDKINGIFRLNDCHFIYYPKKVQNAVIMVYQQGLRDAKELLK